MHSKGLLLMKKMAEIFTSGKSRQFFVFVIFGLINTGATYFLYLLLLNFMHYQIAYFLVYTFGIILAYDLNSRFVFRVKITARKSFYYPLIYIVQYMIGALLSYILVDLCEVPSRWSLLIVITILVPISYLLNKMILF